MPTDAAIHFSGTWTAAQKGELKEAVNAYEKKRREARSKEDALRDVRPQWIAVTTPLDGSFYYFAHRQGIPESLAGRTVEDLASEIRRFRAGVSDS